MLDTVVTGSSPLLTALSKRGWVCHVAEGMGADTVINEIRRLGQLFGTRAAGRTGALEEVVCPQTATSAHPRSLSARYGLNALPLHVELSHRPRPCRYLLLGCIEPGSSSTGTKLLDWRTLGFTADELDLLETAPILVRTGRRSFYSTILSADHTFLRYDPGCLEAVDDRGQAALRLVEHRLVNGVLEVHQWHRGDVLIIDNWRMLHGRGPSKVGSGRRIVRILVNA